MVFMQELVKTGLFWLNVVIKDMIAYSFVHLGR